MSSPFLKPLLAVFVVSLLSASPCSAAAIFGMTSFDDATVVWDGTNDVKTSNNFVNPTNTDLYSNLGITDPSLLAIAFDWRGPNPGVPNPSIDINKIALILSLDDGVCNPGGCLTPRDMLTNEGFRLPDPGGSTSFDIDRFVIPFYAIMLGAPVTMHYPDDTFLFLLSTTDQARLSAVLALYGASNLHVGLAVDTLFHGVGSIFGLPTFEVVSTQATPVPEPATVLLLGSGLALAQMRRRRLARQR